MHLVDAPRAPGLERRYELHALDDEKQVAAGDTLMVIESMKLETAIKAWREGSVAAVHVGMGQAFQRGAPLISLAPQSGA